MLRHLVRTALLTSIFVVLMAVPYLPGAAPADAAGYCFYLFRNGAGVTICL